MMTIYSFINIGFKPLKINIECSQSRGLPSTTIVGLAGKSVDEAKERIRSAITNSGLQYPKKRIVVNLAPADVQKDTTSLDLAIAISILQADKQLPTQNDSYCYIGELGLDGSLRGVRGIIGKLLCEEAKRANKIIIPQANATQAALLKYDNVFIADSLVDVVQSLSNPSQLKKLASSDNLLSHISSSGNEIDISEIRGQESAKRALIIAAAGGHNILLTGPPGTGKSMLAKVFSDILPPLNTNQSLEVSHIHSLASVDFESIITRCPIRNPHHTASEIAITGGGSSLKPGEISLAHHGVLFLDELPEFKRGVLESLRQPMEDGVITISRAQASATFPAKFTLIATANPCPCGYLYSKQDCNCSPSEIARYNRRLSGPIMDRIDMHVFVDQINHKELLSSSSKKPANPMIRKLVDRTRKLQLDRQNSLNSHLSNKNIRKTSKLSDETKNVLDAAANSLKLSPRAYMKVVKVARTIADIEDCTNIEVRHISEAIQYRPRSNEL